MLELRHFLKLKRGNYEQSALQMVRVFSEADCQVSAKFGTEKA
jgi:hypothetical protein